MISAMSPIGPGLTGPLAGWPVGELFLLGSMTLVGMGLTDLGGLLGGDDGDGDGPDDGDELDDDVGGGDPLEGELGDDDDFGDLDEWDDEGSDDVDGGGGSAAELEPRVDELEKEVESVSSSMGTVRSENEAINETVEELEENIRKLLDIYEMVTRGVNPFVDDVQEGEVAGMEGSFGLFDDADGGGQETEELDPDVADADPDEFFDDDFEVEEEETADLEDDGFDEEEAEGTEEGADGKTFDDLKSEYEAGEWEGEGESDEPAEGWDDDLDVDEEPPEDPTIEAEDPEEESSGTERSADGKPYLETVPPGYASELLVIEWLTFLREQSDTSEALRAIKYYETIGWIGTAAASTLQGYLSGLGGENASPLATGGETQLTIDHHTRSLRYIGRLGGEDVDVERLDWGGTGTNGDGMERRGHRGIQR